MIRPIVKDVVFLGEKSEDATKADLSVVEDLIDTLRANLNGCVGMAANMIGVKKRIIVFAIGEMIVPMINVANKPLAIPLKPSIKISFKTFFIIFLLLLHWFLTKHIV